MSKIEFCAWLQDLDINFDALPPDKRVEYRVAFDKSRVASASSTITVFYCASALLVGSKLVKGGVRAGSCLPNFFKDRSRKDCALFINDLDDVLRYYPLLTKENIQINRSFDEVLLVEQPTSVLMRDYNSNESDSEAYSVAITRITHVTGKNVIDLETELLMIENSAHEDFVGLECYRCHLMSQAHQFPENKDNPNNILWMSWSTHQRFDGLNTGEAYRVPQIAISCVEKSTIPELFENGMERYKVIVAVECPNDDILAVMRNRLKAGMTILNEEKKILTYVFVEDADEFERFLTFKYNETKFIWTKKACGTIFYTHPTPVHFGENKWGTNFLATCFPSTTKFFRIPGVRQSNFSLTSDSRATAFIVGRIFEKPTPPSYTGDQLDITLDSERKFFLSMLGNLIQAVDDCDVAALPIKIGLLSNKKYFANWSTVIHAKINGVDQFASAGKAVTIAGTVCFQDFIHNDGKTFFVQAPTHYGSSGSPVFMDTDKGGISSGSTIDDPHGSYKYTIPIGIIAAYSFRAQPLQRVTRRRSWFSRLFCLLCNNDQTDDAYYLPSGIAVCITTWNELYKLPN
eukprot:gene9812-13204_t